MSGDCLTPVEVSISSTAIEVVSGATSVEEVIIYGGPPGPPGPAGFALAPRVAAIDLSGGRVVRPLADGSVTYATCADAGDATAPLWLTAGAALVGQLVGLIPFGEASDHGWTWTVGAPIFLGLDGHLTQIPPAAPVAAFIMQVAACSLEPGSIYFYPRSPIELTS